MDRVSLLPDDLLLKILSYLPTNEVRITSVLSKRWRSLWMLLPKLEYSCGTFNTKTLESFSHFVNKSLLLHKAPVLESLHLSLGRSDSETDIVSCLEIASNRNLHELNVFFKLLSRLRLPRRTCETLVVMHLSYVFLNVTLVPDSFKALKTLHLLCVEFKGRKNKSFTRLLSKCPVLEDLLIDYPDPTQTFTVEVPSLQSLSIMHTLSHFFCLNTPSLKHLKIEGCLMKLCNIQKMPHIVTADVKLLIKTHLLDLPGSLTSAKHLSLCLIAAQGEVPHKPTEIFNQLHHLSFCTCYQDWPSYLKWIIEASPKLQTLKLYHHPSFTFCSQNDSTLPNMHLSDTKMNIPECSLPHLKTFEWRGYEETPENKKLASYILTNASGLKWALISSELIHADKKKEWILKDLNVMRT
ncbi:hypothetical protein N665_1241s0017 [Sinapis alba]|nr:hypothetical protein N665_1241s0017 [Sinapis alba]